MKSTSEIHAASGNLRPAVAALSKVVPRKPSPDGSDHVLVEPLDRNTVRITGTGGGTFLSVDVPGEAAATSGPFLVPFAGLQAVLKGTRPSEEVDLHPGSIPVGRFPEIPGFRAAPVTLDLKVNRSILRAFACASTDETRMVINGALIDVSGGGGNQVVGTDGRHLFRSEGFAIPGLKAPVVLPVHPVWKSPLLRNEAAWTLRVGGDSLSPDSRWYRIDAPGWSLTGRLIEGNFPNYHQVIPGASSFRAGVVLSERMLPQVEKLLGTLPGAKLPHRPIGLRLGKKGLSILARDSEEDAFGEHPVPAVEIRGEPVTVFLDRDYLAKALGFGLNRIGIIDAVSPVKFSRDGELMVIMPVRTPDEIRPGTPEGPVDSPKNPSGEKPGRPAARPGKDRGPHMRQDKGRPERRPEKPLETGKVSGPPDDPSGAAAMQLTQIREALRSADCRLGELASTLRLMVRRQRRTEQEMRAVRGAVRGLRKIEL